LGVGFTTRGIEDVYQRTERFGVDYLSAPIELTPEPEGPTGPRRFEVFGQSLDGEFMVLIERQNVDTPYGTISETWQTSEPLHTSHVVADLGAASSFMCAALDHEVIFKEECNGPEFEQLMAVAPDTRFRFEMLRHPDHSIGRIIFIQYDEEDSAPGPTDAGLAEPPARGMNALRYDCTDLEGAVARAEQAGGTLLRPIVNIEVPGLGTGGLGTGRVAALGSPVGILIELWESQ
jgi:predicted enzyme related to lactoylglutathione lyase